MTDAMSESLDIAERTIGVVEDAQAEALKRLDAEHEGDHQIVLGATHRRSDDSPNEPAVLFLCGDARFAVTTDGEAHPLPEEE